MPELPAWKSAPVVEEDGWRKAPVIEPNISDMTVPAKSTEELVKQEYSVAAEQGVSLGEAGQLAKRIEAKESLSGHFAHGYLKTVIGAWNIPASLTRAVEKTSPIVLGYRLLFGDKSAEGLKKWEKGIPTPIADLLQKPTDYMTRGYEGFIKMHPEWQGVPPDSLVDLITSPRKMSYAMAESIPMLVGAGFMVLTGNIPSAMLIAYAAEGQDAYDMALADTSDRDIAEKARLLYGLPAAAVEFAQISLGLKMAKELYRAALSRMALQAGKEMTKVGGRKLVKDFFLTLLGENVEEWIQGTWQETTAKLLYGKKQQGGLLGWLERRAMESAVITPLVTATGGVSGAVGFAGRVVAKAEPSVPAAPSVAKVPAEGVKVPSKPVEAVTEEKVEEEQVRKRLRQSMGGEIPDTIIDDAMKQAWASEEYKVLDAKYKKAKAILPAGVLGETAESRKYIKPKGDLVLKYTEDAIDKYLAKPTPTAEAVGVEKPPPKPIDRANVVAKHLKTAKRASPEVVEEQREERGRRVGAAAGTMESMMKKGVAPGDAIDKSTAKLAGKLTQYTSRYESIRETLGDSLIQELYRDIATNSDLQYLEVVNTKEALDDLIDGDYLTVGQVELIARQFGGELAKIARKRIPTSDRITRLIAEIAGIPMTMLTAASGDMSGIARQARPLGQAYPKEYIRFVGEYAKSWASEKKDILTAQATRELPFYQEEVDDGVLEVPKYGPEILEPVERGEEFVGARLVEKIPGIGQLTKMAERGFVTGIGWFRSIIYTRVRKAAHRMTAQGHTYDSMTIKDRKRLAGIINDASGRAHFKRLAAYRRWGGFLKVFFAPQFRFARMRMPFRLPVELTRFIKRLAAPKKMYVMTTEAGESFMRDKSIEIGKTLKGSEITDIEEVPQRLNIPEVRMTAGAFASMVATNILFFYLIKMAYMAWGGDPDEFELETDPRSRNSGKIRIKDMRIDLWAGYLQDVQDYAQFVTGTAKSQAGEIYSIDRKQVLLRALRRRSSPLASLVVDILTEETVIGKRFGAAPKGKEGELLNAMQIPEYLQGAGEEVWNRLISLVLQDAMAAWIIEGVPEALTMGFLSHVGVSVATYEKWATSELTELKNKVAQESYGKKWDELTKGEQEEFQPIFEELKVLAGQEKPLRPRSRYITKDEEKIRNRMYEAIPKFAKDELYRIGMTDIGGIGRRWADFVLSDKRYERYEELATPLIGEALTKLFTSSTYEGVEAVSEKRKRANKSIDTAKKEARNLLENEIKDRVI